MLNPNHPPTSPNKTSTKIQGSLRNHHVSFFTLLRGRGDPTGGVALCSQNNKMYHACFVFFPQFGISLSPSLSHTHYYRQRDNGLFFLARDRPKRYSTPTSTLHSSVPAPRGATFAFRVALICCLHTPSTQHYHRRTSSAFSTT